MREMLCRYPIATFLVVTFGWSYGFDALLFLFGWWDIFVAQLPRAWGPLVGAIVVLWANGHSLRGWFSRALDWRVRPRVYALALLLPLLITNLPPLLASLSGGSITYDPPAPLHLMVVWLVFVMLLQGGLEEFGWRGYLQPRLQAYTSVTGASLVIGLFWWAWHLPMFFTGNPHFVLEPGPFLAYFAFVIGVALVLGAFVNATGGRLLPVMLMHASINLGAFISVDNGYLAESVVQDALGAGLWFLIALGLIAAYGVSMHSRPKLVPQRGDLGWVRRGAEKPESV